MTHFKLFNSCRLVKGAKNAMIYDLDRVDNSNLIPHSLYNLLTDHKDKTIDEIKLFYENQYDNEIDEYFQFLIENEYIFSCTEEELSLFPTIDFTYNSPREITNSILDYDGSLTISSYRNFVSQLSQSLCEAVEIRSFIPLSLQELTDFLSLFEETSMVSIEIITPYTSSLQEEDLFKLQRQHPRLRKISFYSSPQEESNEFIHHHKKKINIDMDCGQIDPKYFSIDIETFSEAQSCNTCLNKKISVDKNGLIKGCPSMKKSFGSVSNTSIKEVLDQQAIQEQWNIKKDDIEICKDCEYRYCCTDCRVYTDNSENNYARPSKCNYNPYLGLWKGEANYVEVNEWLKNNK